MSLFRRRVPGLSASRLVLFLTALVLTGCGLGTGGGGGAGGGGGGDTGGDPGGDTGGPGGPPDLTTAFYETTPEPKPAKVVLPDGFAATPDQLRVGTSAGTETPAPDGTLTVPTWLGGPQLALVLDADGDPVLLGWVPLVNGSDEVTELSVRSTAEVMLFWRLAAVFQHERIRIDVIRRFHESPAVDHLATALATALLADPKALTKPVEGVQAAMRDLVAYFSPHGTPERQKLQINPTTIDPLTGVQVAEVGINQVRLSNYLRRRAHAYVERLSYVPLDSDTPVESFNEVSGPVELEPSKPLTTLFQGIAEVGNLLGSLSAGQVPTDVFTTDPLATPLMPESAKRTTYRVSIIGPGGLLNPMSRSVLELTAEQGEHLTQDTAMMFVHDMLLPFLANVAAPQWRGALAQRMGTLTVGDVADLVLTIWDLAPDARDMVVKGDIKGLVDTTINTIFYDNNLREDFFEWIEQRLLGGGGWVTPEDIRIADMFQSIFRVMQAVDQALTTFDIVMQAAQLLSCSVVRDVDVVALPSRVVLSPESVRIAPGDRPTFRATVPDATNDEAPLIKYRFTVVGGHGHLEDDTDAQHSGTSFENSTGEVTYVWDSGDGTDTITVEAFIDGLGSSPDTYLGADDAEVTVTTADVTITPEEVELGRGDASSFVAKVANYTPLPGASYSYVWTCSGGHGAFTNGTYSFESLNDSVTYRVWEDAEADDTVSVQVIVNPPAGPSFVLGTASATVHVTEDRPKTRVIYGSPHAEGTYWFADGWAGGSAGFAVSIPRIGDAESYAVECYGFNDPHYWGTYRVHFFSTDNPHGVSANEEEYKLGFSGGSWWGPAGNSTEDDARASMEGGIAGYAARFAGMIVKVTVTYRDP